MPSFAVVSRQVWLGLSSAAFLLAPLAMAQTAPQTVRVRLFGGQPSGTVTLAGDGAALTLRVDGVAVGTVAAGAAVRVDRSGGRVHVEDQGVDATGSTLEAEAAGGAVRVRGGRYDRRYRGRIEVTHVANRLQIVNQVGLEDYVASVTAHEYPFAEIEGVKAQAVLARTYVLHRAQRATAYDVEDHQGSQVYEGVGAETAVSRAAAEATAGQVMRYRGALIEAVYSSSSGGHTADNETVWGTAPVPYLRGRPDPFDAEAPDHAWRVAVPADRLFGALASRYGALTDVAVSERSREGRAVRVALVGDRPQTVSATDFRAVVNARLGSRTLRSTHFTVRREGADIVFEGRGFGHGVGMSQYGARGQARAGRLYTDILGFYFAGATLDLLPGAAGTPPLLASSRDPYSLPRPSEPVPVVRGTWGPPRARPTPRAQARDAEAEQVEQAVGAPVRTVSGVEAPAAPRPRRTSW